MIKRGQMQLSFGFIMAIIIIAATIGVAFFVIGHFLNLNKCSQIGFFYDDIEEEVDKAWASSIYQDTFVSKLPGGIDQVCFGNLTQGSEIRDVERYNELSGNYHPTDYDNNLFLLPPEKACDGDLAEKKLRHAQTQRFFCVDVVDGEVKVKIAKTSTDALAKLERS